MTTTTTTTTDDAATPTFLSWEARQALWAAQDAAEEAARVAAAAEKKAQEDAEKAARNRRAYRIERIRMGARYRRVQAGE